jgi:GT2 family glycosyltransferase
MDIKTTVVTLFSRKKRLVVRVRNRKLERSKLPYSYKDAPQLSILLQSFNHRKNIPSIMERLRLTCADEIIVCEDGSVDGSEVEWRKYLTRPNDFLIQTNDLHEIRTYNRAANLAAGEFICLMQDDDIPPKDPSWASDAIALFRRYPRLAVVGCWHGWAVDFGDARYPVLARFGAPPFDGKPLSEIPFWDDTIEKPFMFVESICIGPMFFRHSVFQELGKFDLRFSGVGESGIWLDYDFTMRAWLAGYQVGVYASPAFERNVGGQGTMIYSGSSRAANYLKNRDYVYATYANKIASIRKTIGDLNNKGLVHRDGVPDIPLGHKFDGAGKKYLIITMNHCTAGFFAYVNFVINQLMHAERNDLHPVVFFGRWSGDGENPFFSPEHGDNMWDYYFEPVAGLTYSDLMKKVRDPNDPTSDSDLMTLKSDDMWWLHDHDPESAYTYPHGGETARYEQIDEPAHWYKKQRERARWVVERYIRVKPHVAQKVDDFVRAHFGDGKVIGVHMRGTDKGTASLPRHLMRIVKPQEYFKYIDDYTQENSPAKIFVATDQQQFLSQVRNRYGGRVLSYDAKRATGLLNPFQVKGDGYRKGEDVLIDCLLLSRTNFLLKCTSAVGEIAFYFNPALAGIDLNEQTRSLSKMQMRAVELRHRLWLRYLRYKKRI